MNKTSECPAGCSLPLIFTKLITGVGFQDLQFQLTIIVCKGKKVLPYSLPSVGPRADPGVQAVIPQVTFGPPPAVGCRYFLPGLRLYLVSIHQMAPPPIDVENI